MIDTCDQQYQVITQISDQNKPQRNIQLNNTKSEAPSSIIEDIHQYQVITQISDINKSHTQQQLPIPVRTLNNLKSEQMIDEQNQLHNYQTIIEESCVYCSKCLTGLNNFNRKMHIETCKVRKLVDANNHNSPDSQLDSFIVVGENCSYCFKSFKDFKSDFNKRLHIKCCRIKKETYDEKNNAKNNMGGEHCVFCTKPLGNLNDFNKRMHIENCKIRKSIENNGQPVYSAKKGVKDENLVKLGLELGDNCYYCSKSFVNLSDFNKKLHFEYCKLKKRKLAHLSQTLNMGACSNNSDNNNSINCSPVQHVNNVNKQPQLNGQAFNSSPISSNNNNNNSNHSVQINAQLMNMSNHEHDNNSVNQQQNNCDDQDQMNKMAKLDLGESCLFCSRSLVNLSNFNKRIHIETCKIKTLKKATSKLRQTNTSASATKAPRKRKPKKEKIDASFDTSINNLYCQNLNKTLTLELMGSNLGNLVSLNANQSNQLAAMSNNNNNNQNQIQISVLQPHQIIQGQQVQHQVHQNNQDTNWDRTSQFDSLVASLNGHTSTINLTQMQQHIQQNQLKQLSNEPSGTYRLNNNNDVVMVNNSNNGDSNNNNNNPDGIFI